MLWPSRKCASRRSPRLARTWTGPEYRGGAAKKAGNPAGGQQRGRALLAEHRLVHQVRSRPHQQVSGVRRRFVDEVDASEHGEGIGPGLFGAVPVEVRGARPVRGRRDVERDLDVMQVVVQRPRRHQGFGQRMAGESHRAAPDAGSVPGGRA